MAVLLRDDEARVLAWALDNYLPELRYELARVKRGRDRHELVVREEMLSAIRERLEDYLRGAIEGPPASAR